MFADPHRYQPLNPEIPELGLATWSAEKLMPLDDQKHNVSRKNLTKFSQPWSRVLTIGSFLLCLWIVYQTVISRIGWTKNELIVCGGDTVLILDYDQSDHQHLKIQWQWSPLDSRSISPKDYNKFGAIDECKPVSYGQRILITSSHGGVILLERSTKIILFQSYVENAHSAELLPDDRVVVAASTSKKGNCLELYDLNNSRTPLFREYLYSAHGVVWDNDRKKLYALSHDELREYFLMDWLTSNPKLKIGQTFKFNGTSGHDLQPLTEELLIITETHNVWIFNKETQTFTEYPDLRKHEHVKSVSIHPVTHQIAYVQAEEKWWAHSVRTLNLSGEKNQNHKTLYFPDLNVYKSRWNVNLL